MNISPHPSGWKFTELEIYKRVVPAINLHLYKEIVEEKFFCSFPDLLYRQTLNVNNSMFDVEIVDVCCGGQEPFPEEAIYWADACVVCYEITCKESFKEAISMLQQIPQLKSMLTVLLGNKADLEHLRQVRNSLALFIFTSINFSTYEMERI